MSRLRLSDVIARATSSTVANWELAVVFALAGALAGAVFVAGIVPPLLVAGIDPAALLSWPPGSGDVPVPAPAFPADPLSFAAALLASALIWLAGLSILAFAFAGAYGVLWAADRQSPPGAPRATAWFRTFSLAHLAGWGGRRLGCYLRLLLLQILVSAACVVAVAALVLLATGGALRWGETAAVGIGCGGLLPLLFVAFVILLWVQFAFAAAARDRGGALAAARDGLAALGSRLGAATIGYLLWVIAAVTLQVGFFFLALVAGIGFGAPHGSAQGLVLESVRMVANSLLSLWLAAFSVALTRDELAGRGT